MRVGYQGEPGAFSEEAIVALFGEVPAQGFFDFDALVDAVDRGAVDVGLLPCENSLFGSIARSYDLLFEHPGVTIAAETVHPVVQCLIGMPGAGAGTLESIASHPVALEQCRTFLATLPRVTVVPAADTAGAVREMMARGDAAHGAIGPALSARRYGGVVLAHGVQDSADNATRFFAIARRPIEGLRASGKACLAFHLAHEAGSLYRALGTLSERALNLRNLVVRPRRDRPFEYTFYAEIDAGRLRPRCRRRGPRSRYARSRPLLTFARHWAQPGSELLHNGWVGNFPLEPNDVFFKFNHTHLSATSSFVQSIQPLTAFGSVCVAASSWPAIIDTPSSRPPLPRLTECAPHPFPPSVMYGKFV